MLPSGCGQSIPHKLVCGGFIPDAEVALPGPEKAGENAVMRRTLCLIVALASATLACDDNPVAPSDVVAHEWQLVSIEREGSSPVVVPDPSRYTLRLEQGGRVMVRSDCNSCGGTYSMSGLSLEIASLACTRAFCGEASLDSTYVQALEGTKTLSADAAELTIGGNGRVLRFRR
jgi:heat shock protein HslJ